MSGGALVLVEPVIRLGDLLPPLPPTQPDGEEAEELGDNTFPTAGGVKLPFTDAGVFDLLPLARLLGRFSSMDDDDEDELVNSGSADDAGIVIFFSVTDDEEDEPLFANELLLVLGLGDPLPLAAVPELEFALPFDFFASPLELLPLLFLAVPPPAEEDVDEVDRSEDVEEVPAVPVPESRPDELDEELDEDEEEEERVGHKGFAFGGSAPI